MKRLCAGRAGSVLVFMIIVVALTSGLALLSGSFIASRARLAADARVRAELRQASISAVARAAWQIDGDTNGVDHLAEPWASESVLGETCVRVEDDAARLRFPGAGPAALAALFVAVSDVDPKAAAVEAERVHAWWDQVRTASTNRVLAAAEVLSFVPGVDVALVARARPHLTVLGDGRVNLNTVEPEVWRALVAGVGGEAGLADRLHAQLRQMRQRGDVLQSLDPVVLAMRLADGGYRPSPDEWKVMQALLPKLTVESGRFRVTATCVRGNVWQSVQCVYLRGSGRILRWLENADPPVQEEQTKRP